MMEEESEQDCRKRAFTKEENGRGEEYNWKDYHLEYWKSLALERH